MPVGEWGGLRLRRVQSGSAGLQARDCRESLNKCRSGFGRFSQTKFTMLTSGLPPRGDKRLAF